MSRNDTPPDDRDPADGSGDEDSINLTKRLVDNQPLSNTHKVHDEGRGQRRQYGVRTVEPRADEPEPNTPRGPDGRPE